MISADLPSFRSHGLGPLVCSRSELILKVYIGRTSWDGNQPVSKLLPTQNRIRR